MIVPLENNKIAFTRSRDVIELLNLATDMILKMANTLETISKLTDYPWTQEEIIDMYERISEGPTIFESILIKQGNLTEEECSKNFFENQLLNSLQILLDE